MKDLGLQTQVEKHFGFLISEKNYKCTATTSSYVRFESPTTFVAIVFDGNRSFELDLLIGKTGSENPTFTIGEVLRLRGVSEREIFSQVTTAEALSVGITKLAQAIRLYAEDFIIGNKKSFAELAKQRTRECENYALERNLRIARAEVEKAWHKKDYELVVKNFKPFRAALTATEVGKLEFAETQLKQ
jgi:hypothetical protein